MVFYEQQPADKLFVILKGVVSLWVTRPDDGSGAAQHSDIPPGISVARLSPHLQQLAEESNKADYDRSLKLRPWEFIPESKRKKVQNHYLGLLRADGHKVAFGELGLLNNAPRSASIKAEGECHFAVVEKNTFDDLIRSRYEAQMQDKLRRIRMFPCFRHQSEAYLNRISLYMTQRECGPNRLLLRENTPGRHVFCLIEGVCEVFTRHRPSSTCKQPVRVKAALDVSISPPQRRITKNGRMGGEKRKERTIPTSDDVDKGQSSSEDKSSGDNGGDGERSGDTSDDARESDADAAPAAETGSQVVSDASGSGTDEQEKDERDEPGSSDHGSSEDGDDSDAGVATSNGKSERTAKHRARRSGRKSKKKKVRLLTEKIEEPAKSSTHTRSRSRRAHGRAGSRPRTRASGNGAGTVRGDKEDGNSSKSAAVSLSLSGSQSATGAAAKSESEFHPFPRHVWDSSDFKLASFGPGSMFGYRLTAASGRQEVSIRTASRCKFFVISQEDFHRKARSLFKYLRPMYRAAAEWRSARLQELQAEPLGKSIARTTTLHQQRGVNAVSEQTGVAEMRKDLRQLVGTGDHVFKEAMMADVRSRNKFAAFREAAKAGKQQKSENPTSPASASVQLRAAKSSSHHPPVASKLPSNGAKQSEPAATNPAAPGRPQLSSHLIVLPDFSRVTPHDYRLVGRASRSTGNRSPARQSHAPALPTSSRVLQPGRIFVSNARKLRVRRAVRPHSADLGWSKLVGSKPGDVSGREEPKPGSTLSQMDEQLRPHALQQLYATPAQSSTILTREQDRRLMQNPLLYRHKTAQLPTETKGAAPPTTERKAAAESTDMTGSAASEAARARAAGLTRAAPTPPAAAARPTTRTATVVAIVPATTSTSEAAVPGTATRATERRAAVLATGAEHEKKTNDDIAASENSVSLKRSGGESSRGPAITGSVPATMVDGSTILAREVCWQLQRRLNLDPANMQVKTKRGDVGGGRDQETSEADKARQDGSSSSPSRRRPQSRGWSPVNRRAQPFQHHDRLTTTTKRALETVSLALIAHAEAERADSRKKPGQLHQLNRMLYPLGIAPHAGRTRTPRDSAPARAQRQRQRSSLKSLFGRGPSRFMKLEDARLYKQWKWKFKRVGRGGTAGKSAMWRNMVNDSAQSKAVAHDSLASIDRDVDDEEAFQNWLKMRQVEAVRHSQQHWLSRVTNLHISTHGLQQKELRSLTEAKQLIAEVPASATVELATDGLPTTASVSNKRRFAAVQNNPAVMRLRTTGEIARSIVADRDRQPARDQSPTRPGSGREQPPAGSRPTSRQRQSAGSRAGSRVSSAALLRLRLGAADRRPELPPPIEYQEESYPFFGMNF